MAVNFGHGERQKYKVRITALKIEVRNRFEKVERTSSTYLSEIK